MQILLHKIFKLSFKKWPSILWAIFILVLSTIPGPSLPQQKLFPHLDKIVHFIFYLILVILSFNGWKENKNGIIIICLVLSYGVGIELIQHFFIEKRFFDIYDVVANTAGVLVGLKLNFSFLKKTNQFNNK
jgi:VanZ family protein